MTLDEIREALRDRRIVTVARECGLHENTLYRIMNGVNDNPSYETIKRITDYLGRS
jgi:DNA-binding phage protein